MEKTNPPFEKMIGMRIVFSVPGMDSAWVQRNLVYKTIDKQPLHMDVHSSPGVPQPRPAVILFHGGPIPRIGAKNMGVFVSYGELLAASGFVGICFDHRFVAPARIADATGDVADLVAHIRKNAGSIGVDPERLALWAFSGGGPFLAAPLRERPAWLRALVAFYPVLDLERTPTGADSEISKALRRSFSAIRGLGEDARSAAPILVARAGLDDPWLNGAGVVISIVKQQ
jgi:acetyl esterase/lipase